MSHFFRQHRRVFLAQVVVIPLGFLSKFYSGPGEDFVNNSLGGLLYVVFWTLLFSLIFPGTRALKVAAAVLLVTCTLEFLQRWHPPFLEWVRASFIGATLIGNTFVWSDLIWYIAGSLVSLALLRGLRTAPGD